MAMTASVEKRLLLPILGVIFLKVLLLLLFSSDYKDLLFVPFIDQFAKNLLSNPWEIVYQNHLPIEFPYPPLTLWFLSFFYLVFAPFGLGKVLFCFPLLLCDIGILFSLRKILPGHDRKLFLFYFLSPVVIFSTFVHCQLDLIPISLLIYSLSLLERKKYLKSFTVLGFALSTKFHILAVLPLYAIFLIKQRMFREGILSIIIPGMIFFVIASPYILSEGFLNLVLVNPKQNSVFDSFYKIEELKVYLPIFALLAIYGRFSSYYKINFELFLSFVGISFAIFLILVKPSPGWYIWIAPFLCLLLARQSRIEKSLIVFTGFSLVYCIYFIFFHPYDFHHLNFLNERLFIQVSNPKLTNISFTCLFTAMSLIIVLFYRNGIKSNEIYKKLSSFVIGIGGDSGAGKSTLLADLARILGSRLLQIEGDGEHKWERGNANWKVVTHLDPKANNLHMQAQNIQRLKNLQSVYRRDYDHATGKFTDPILLVPKDFIVISGLHPFYLPIMRKVLDLKIFLNTDERLRLHWKLLRDQGERGHEPEKILQQEKMRDEDRAAHIHPQTEFADLIVRFRPLNDFIPGGPTNPEIALDLTFDASFQVEDLIVDLGERGYELEWNYSANLRQQVVRVYKVAPIQAFAEIARKHIPNLDELIETPDFETDFRGLLQLFILFVMSQKMLEEKNS